ncbi:erythromycin esterase family protein [Tenggerimyces flavus]|uniref:Erythromycin esterase family protein n=1 Tax=Tenggerimyces flavus TaxID=1708749 RepID=A0ABV7YMH7_9ACTN|nr:erythromycin esterase family protein [Tenggerimyces flavus]MBM7787574.1 erythromycin esterase-like protein [Tenggerimyces flavus]
MSQDIREFLPSSFDVLALGEPTHLEPVFGRIRNDLLTHLVDQGVRSIAIESDRIAALVVDDFVREGVGSLDEAMSAGFSHNLGTFDTYRQLVAWLREYNQSRPVAERVAFHGFDAPTENMSAPSPLAYLEKARDYLKLDHDLASLVGDDERWSRTEAILDPAASPGATQDAEQLRAIGEEMLRQLDDAPADTVEWRRARIHLTAGLGLLRYHKQSARPEEQAARIYRLLSLRDGLMAQNLIEIRQVEARRGRTVLFAHNTHLQKHYAAWRLGEMDLGWIGAGAIVAALWGDKYVFVAGSLGRSEHLGLGEPESDTHEGLLQKEFTTWGLTATDVRSGRVRTDHDPRTGLIPLNPATLDGADAILHIADA